MRRLLIACVITIVLGVGIYLVGDLIIKNKEDEPVAEKTEETVQIDVYQNKITTEELIDTIKDKETIVVFLGSQEDEATINVGKTLGSIKEIESFSLYYLEKKELDDLTYQSLLNNYPDLTNYLNFTPVILVFKESTLVGGLPGEVEKKNIIQFFNYVELM